MANGANHISTLDCKEVGIFSFQQVEGHDLAVSEQIVNSSGFENIVTPKIGSLVTMIGHHGSKKKYFEISAQVVGFDDKGRIIIKRIKGKIFQLGMSGSPVYDKDNNFFGVLVAGVSGTDGEKAYLEPASSLL